tara:strand:- start:996 stop:1172 length:177 start_codon:yes stop_codon:yes gene_type:complete
MNKKDPIFKWHEKLQLYIAGFILLGFIVVGADLNEKREIEDKIQECYQFLEEHESPTN